MVNAADLGTPARRPIAARSAWWAGRMAAGAARLGVSPNAISLASVVAAAGGAALIAWPAGWPGWVGAAACVQVRLLCNLLDGMVAIEGGRGSPRGALFNEVPDRVSDTLLLVALGYAAGEPALGWAGAVLAVGTAYVRLLGGSLGVAQDFSGVMAKQQRMAVLTVALLAEAAIGGRLVLLAAAAVVAAGSLVTCVTRLARVARELAP